ncbi:conserved hypothetical protein [delta proteobacterium NaphS2]|nr:conserved hypothetical protein [delta proteobacterium NaphS2]
MNGKEKKMMRNLRKCMKWAMAVFSILGLSVIVMSCADLQEDYNASGWQYRLSRDAPPSWENDYGRPPFGGEGETPFN